jgi:putative phage-type endonuclease
MNTIKENEIKSPKIVDIMTSLTKNINKDINLILNDLFDNSDLSKDHINNNELLDDCITYVLNMYNSITDCNDTNDYLINQIRHIILEYCDIEKQPLYNESQLEFIKHKIQYLEQLPQPEQRTPEWYEFRNNRLTASDLLSATDKKSGKYIDLIVKKCIEDTKKFTPGLAILHGIKFEPIATSIYEKRLDLKIIEFGCLPHYSIPYFGASPDGIVSYDSNNKNYVGRMLEIKCPKSRKITGIIPEGYYAQVQGQLEVCDLEYCDFLECDFQIYDNIDLFYEDIHKTNKLLNKKEYEKGIIIELYNTKTNSRIYKYSEDKHIINRTNYERWEHSILHELFEENTSSHMEYVSTTFWYLNKINIVLVKRDKGWFGDKFGYIKGFWEDVLKNRLDNCEELLKNKKTRNKKSINNTSNYKYKEEELNFID